MLICAIAYTVVTPDPMRLGTLGILIGSLLVLLGFRPPDVRS